MSADTLFVFVLIGIAAALMASNRVRFDVVALLVVLALMLSRVLTPTEALSGFGSPVVILVAGLLVVGDMLDRTGVANAIGNLILKHGGTSETRLLIFIMIGAAVLGAVMSSTAVVAIFIPIVLRIARETKLSASRILLPMSYAALISGMLTLIATTPNLVVSEELKAAGYDGFQFFSFTLIGIAVLVVAVLYVLFFGRRLLPKAAGNEAGHSKTRPIDELWLDYRGIRRFRQLRVNPASLVAGKTMEEANFRHDYNVHIFGIRRVKRGRQWSSFISPTTELLAYDELGACGKPEDLDRLESELAMTSQSITASDEQRRHWEIGSAAVLIHPESTLLGKSLREVKFRSRYMLHVLGIRRQGEALSEYEDVKLQPSDSLLVSGPWQRIEQLQTWSHDFVLLEVPAETGEVVPAYRKMPISLIILGVMVLLSVFDVIPLVAAVIMASMAAVFTRCLTMEDSYRAIHWSSLVLVAGMLPLADALEKTGGTQIIVDNLMGSMGASGPHLMLTVLFFLTAALGLFLSNTAAAVLVAPIAISSAEALEVSPYPFALAVLIAASAAFMTPVSTPVVTLVVEPGRYRFIDFVKVGVPLLLLTYLVTVLLAPMVFPFTSP